MIGNTAILMFDPQIMCYFWAQVQIPWQSLSTPHGSFSHRDLSVCALVTKLDGCSMVSGIQWLEQVSPIVTWTQKTITPPQITTMMAQKAQSCLPAPIPSTAWQMLPLYPPSRTLALRSSVQRLPTDSPSIAYWTTKSLLGGETTTM